MYFLQYHRGHLSQNTTLTRLPLIWFLLSPETKANLKTWLLPKIGISSLRFSSYFFYGRTREEVFPVISFQVRFSEVCNFNILENAIKEDYYLKKYCTYYAVYHLRKRDKKGCSEWRFLFFNHHRVWTKHLSYRRKWKNNEKRPVLIVDCNRLHHTFIYKSCWTVPTVLEYGNAVWSTLLLVFFVLPV